MVQRVTQLVTEFWRVQRLYNTWIDILSGTPAQAAVIPKLQE